MARIRSIKPEFWSSPNLPKDPWERLLFVAMWNWADDSGVGTAIPRELLGFAFPNDEHITVVDLRRMLVGIRRGFGVMFYTVAGRPYYSIPSWEEHQKFDRRSKGKHPGPDEAETWLYLEEDSDSAESHESPSSPRRDSVAGTGEQGNIGTGEQGITTLSEPAASNVSNAYPEAFEMFWSAYPLKSQKRDALKAWKTAIQRAGNDELIAGATRYADDPNRDDDYTKLAAGWLRADMWLDPPIKPRLAQQSVASKQDAKINGYLERGQRLADAVRNGTQKELL